MQYFKSILAISIAAVGVVAATQSETPLLTSPALAPGPAATLLSGSAGVLALSARTAPARSSPECIVSWAQVNATLEALVLLALLPLATTTAPLTALEEAEFTRDLRRRS
ncbi:hypothetical protein NM688_g3570 [Phlebia brevispora]|uniref:Uncharacterized protein n=1 Tax=Phlebia brevispora TaxID=194682 RepID=A0ACC1T565_9APHY|nr:hypothetical protein NM688_g3570 [Phlebia brevispora]